MQGKQLFEYAVIRIVPRVEREEFFNVGVVLYCRQQRFLKMIFSLNETKLHALCELADAENFRQYLVAFERICKGDTAAGPIAHLDVASRFRWLTATRSTVVQASKVHPGFCEDPEKALMKLFEELVL